MKGRGHSWFLSADRLRVITKDDFEALNKWKQKKIICLLFVNIVYRVVLWENYLRG